MYFFCADWKFLALCVGIDAANATFACIWCKCPKCDRHDLSKTWSLTNLDEGARSIEEIQNCAKKGKNQMKNIIALGNLFCLYHLIMLYQTCYTSFSE